MHDLITGVGSGLGWFHRACGFTWRRHDEGIGPISIVLAGKHSTRSLGMLPENTSRSEQKPWSANRVKGRSVSEVHCIPYMDGTGGPDFVPGSTISPRSRKGFRRRKNAPSSFRQSFAGHDTPPSPIHKVPKMARPGPLLVEGVGPSPPPGHEARQADRLEQPGDDAHADRLDRALLSEELVEVLWPGVRICVP